MKIFSSRQRITVVSVNERSHSAPSLAEIFYTLPGPVRNLNAQNIREMTADIHWEAPLGGATEYRITFINYWNDQMIHYTNQTNFTVTALRANNQNTINVQAFGLVGYSSVETITFWTPPRQPSYVRFPNTQHDQIEVTWYSPHEGGCLFIYLSKV